MRACISITATRCSSTSDCLKLPTVWVEFLARYIELLDAVHNLRGKSFVQLEDGDVIHAESRLFCMTRGRHSCEAHTHAASFKAAVASLIEAA